MTTRIVTVGDDLTLPGSVIVPVSRITDLPSTFPPTTSSVVNATVADNAGIVLSKTADGTSGAGRLAMTNAERAKLAGYPTSLTGPLVIRYSGTSWPVRGTSDVGVTAFWVDYTGAAALPSGFLVGSDVLVQDASV